MSVVIFLILCGFGMDFKGLAVIYFLWVVKIGVYSQTFCSNLITYYEDDNLRRGNFYISYPNSTQQTYIQIIVYVSDVCQGRACSISIITDVDTAKELYRLGRPVRYAVFFTDEAKEATVKGIALRSSTECRVICKHETETIEPSTKALQTIINPNGRTSIKRAACDPIQSFSEDSNASDETCGVVPDAESTVQHLVLRGLEIVRGSWPWLVAIYHRTGDSSSLLCGGTLLSHRTILTASHCLFNEFAERLLPESLEVYVGRHDRSNANEKGFAKYSVHRIEIHPDYRTRVVSFDSDIALLFTDSDIRYTKFIRPACIWEGNEPIEALVNRTGVVVGWGLDESLRSSTRPKKVVSNIVSYDDCIDSNPIFAGVTTKRNFCAGRRDGSGPCIGDSGGAFMIEVSGRWMVRGVVSGSAHHRQNVCDLYSYVVYADVFKFKHWLSEKMSSYVPIYVTTPSPEITSTPRTKTLEELIEEIFTKPSQDTQS